VTMELEQRDHDLTGYRPAAVVSGIVLLGIGVAMFLDTTEAIHIQFGRLIGPFVLITLGASMTLGSSAFVCNSHRPRDGESRGRQRRRGGATSGIWLMGVGVWLLLSQTGAFGLAFHNSWPLLIILGGVITVIRGFK